MHVAANRHSIAFLHLSFYFRDAAILLPHLLYSLMYDMRFPLLLSVLDHSHLAYTIRFIHSTRDDNSTRADKLSQ